MTDIIGVTFPIPKKWISRFFEDKKDIFIKPGCVFKEVKPGLRFVFYQSHEDTGFVGEAKIKSVIFKEDPMEFYPLFGSRIFLTVDEMKAYLDYQEHWSYNRKIRNEKKKRSWMAIELEKITLYSSVKKPIHFVPVGGQYLRKE